MKSWPKSLKSPSKQRHCWVFWEIVPSSLIIYTPILLGTEFLQKQWPICWKRAGHCPRKYLSIQLGDKNELNINQLHEIIVNKHLLYMLLVVVTGCTTKDWRTACRESAGIAHYQGSCTSGLRSFYMGVEGGQFIPGLQPNQQTKHPIRSWGYRLAAKQGTASNAHWKGSFWLVLVWNASSITQGIQRGGGGKLIEAVDQAAKNYPWPDTYKAFPGPNSNTFSAWIGKQVPELGLILPFLAIGSGYAISKYK